MSLFLTIIIAGYAIFGAQVETGTSAADLAPGGWVKYRLSLSADPAVIDADLAELAGHPLLLTIHNSTEVGRLSCAPLSDVDTWTAQALVLIDRYHPQAVEIWNEPDGADAYPELLGCNWQPQQYSDFASYVCQRIEQEHPEVITLAGAMATMQFASYIQPGVCDGISFHYYTQFSQQGDDWKGLQDDIRYLVSLGYENIWLTETSLLDDEQGYLQAEWYYFVRQQNIPVFWYTLSGNGWRNSDMMDHGVPRPVWNAYQR